MKSVAIKDAKKFELIDIDEPTRDDKKVIIDVLRTGICGSDIHYWDIGMPKGLVMGHEFCGIVVDAGDRLDLNVGDKVTALPISPCGKCEACLSGNIQFCPHTWDEAVGLSINNPGGLTRRIAVRSDMVLKVPDDMNSDEVAMVEPTAVGLHAAHLGRIAVGDNVLVVGAGIIGLTSALFAKMEGASKVYISETNEKRGQNALDLSIADKWVNPIDDKEYIPHLLEDTNGGFDVVIECVGNKNAVDSALTLVKPGGIVVLVGVSISEVPIATTKAVLKELVLQGAIGYTYNEFKTCIDLIYTKKINVLPFIDSVVPLSKVQESYERLTSGCDKAVKILVDPSEE